MKIVITWTTWFIWWALVRYFANKNIEILAFWRKLNFSWFENFSNVSYFSWDINDELENKNILKNVDVFIHSACNLDYSKSKKELIKDNVNSLANILEATKNIKHFIYISSSSVYQWKSGIIKVEDKINIKDLKNSYSLSKYLSEQYILENLKNEKVSILRPRAVYWKWDRVLVPTILKNQIFGKLILPWSWKNKTSITNINDFVLFIEKVILDEKTWIYNFSSKIETYESLYLDIVKKYNLKWIINIPIFIFKMLNFFNKNKYSYIVDTFWSDKILD